MGKTFEGVISMNRRDFFNKAYWRERKQRRKDAKAVLQGKAVAVTWESE